MAQFKGKIHNLHRKQKLEGERRAREYIMTPPQDICKNALHNYYNRVMIEKGYDYKPNGSRTLKWMYEQFEDKMKKYLGNTKMVKKQTRMDKVYLKEKLNFKNQVNPLVTIFSRLNRNIEKRMLICAFSAIG